MQPYSRSVRLIAIVCLCLAGLFSPVAQAQEENPALLVTLRDQAEQGLAGIAVEVRDTEGRHSLLRANTAADGTAYFATLPDLSFRILPLGYTPQGAALSLPGADAGRGLLAFGGTTTPLSIDLLVEEDGTVRIDPFRMLPLEPVDQALPPPTLTALAAAIPPAPPPAERQASAGGAAVLIVPSPLPLVEPIPLAGPQPPAGGLQLRALVSLLALALISFVLFRIRPGGGTAA